MNQLRFVTTAGLAVLLALCVLAPVARADFIVNGSFEAVPFTRNGDYSLGLTDADVPGWHVPSTDGTYPWGIQNGAFGGGPAADGIQWVVLGEVSSSVDYTIQQTMVGLTPGNTYHLTFEIASEGGCCSRGEVSFLSGSSTPAANLGAPTSGDWWTAWRAESMDFVASSSVVTVQFKDLATPDFGGLDLGLDNVHVTGATTIVPEPASLMLLGLGLLGFSLPRGRKVV